MLNRLAVVIVGVQNSGKTTTLKHFCDTYYRKKVSTFKMGWRFGLSIFKPRYWGIKIDAFFIPASRTERDEYLIDLYKKLGWDPDFIFMAEQLNGKRYSDTIHYLMANGFHVKEFVLSNKEGNDTWDRWRNDLEREAKLLHRTEQIADYVRSFISTKI